VGDNAAKEIGEHILKLDRMLRSIMRAVWTTVDVVDPAVPEVVKFYSSETRTEKHWIDKVQPWSEKGAVLRIEAREPEDQTS